MEVSGSKHVPIAGSESKMQITALVTVSAAGVVLPPQLLYEEKTVRCDPPFNYLAEWDVWHTPNHWSNEETILCYLDKVFIPYVERKCQEAGFLSTQKVLLLLANGHIEAEIDTSSIHHLP